MNYLEKDRLIEVIEVRAKNLSMRSLKFVAILEAALNGIEYRLINNLRPRFKSFFVAKKLLFTIHIQLLLPD